jgi:hypothetical protein
VARTKVIRWKALVERKESKAGSKPGQKSGTTDPKSDFEQ